MDFPKIYCRDNECSPSIFKRKEFTLDECKKCILKNHVVEVLINKCEECNDMHSIECITYFNPRIMDLCYFEDQSGDYVKKDIENKQELVQLFKLMLKEEFKLCGCCTKKKHLSA